MKNTSTDEYIGKSILIGITFKDSDDNLLVRKQIAGEIIRIEDNRIVILPLQSNQEFCLPPDFSLLKPAELGTYRLKDGNVAEFTDPTYTAQFEIHNDNNQIDIDRVISHGYEPADN